MPQADLELTLHRRDATGDNAAYSVDLRFLDPTSEADKRLSSAASISFDPAELRMRFLDAAGYGSYLTGQLFAAEDVRGFFNEALAVAQGQAVPLGLRLAIGPSAPELHGLRWETLRLPGSDAPLLMGEHVLFSRYLSSLDWRPVRLRPQADMAALVVVASPGDWQTNRVAEVRTEAELAAARVGLGDIPVTELAARGQVTLANLAAALRDGYDILYLVAHGLLVDGEPRILLENEDGTGLWVAGRELVARIYELQERPRLVVLVSCQSAGEGGGEPTTQDGGVLAGLGPRLAEAGVPAVIAMQGNLTMQTAAKFMPEFFNELRRDGQVDRAMAAARGAVRERPDWWMPVLFMRLGSGRIGYKPGFSTQAGGLEKWPALMRNIRAGRCTPIVGPGLTEWLLGSRQEIAARWSETFRFPMHPDSRESLPQVAQFLKVRQDVHFMRDELTSYLRGELDKHFGNLVSAMRGDAPLDDVISAVSLEMGQDPATLTIRTLASLPLPIYVTTNPSNLLTHALESLGKKPVVEMCRWNTFVEQIPSIFDADREPHYRPTTQRPLVYHLFGRISEPDSLVITEDDYFDYLIGATKNNDLIPLVVRRALADSALLFLGFDLDEWDFRVLFRILMLQEGGGARRDYAHVAAQIDPESGRIIEAEGARRYLTDYFGKQAASISIFWGSVADFGRELAGQLSRS